jgi:citrate synthase
MSYGTEIDGVDLERDCLLVRGVDLVELIGTTTFVGILGLLLLGRRLDACEEVELDRWLSAALMKSAESNDPARKIALAMAAAGGDVISATMAGMVAPVSVDQELSLPERLATTDSRTALALISRLALLSTLNEQAPAGAPPGEKFIDKLTWLARGGRFGNSAILDMLLVGFSAGFGFLTPTVLLPRVSAGTGAPTAHSLVAGLAGAGPYHVGACADTMRLFSGLGVSEAGFEGRLRSKVDAILAKGGRLPGIGHPVFECDPRTARLRELGGQEIAPDDGAFLRAYDLYEAVAAERVGLRPNVDAISAALLLSLNVSPDTGTMMFLTGRAAAMVAHVAERRKAPPFGATRKMIRALLTNVPPEAAPYHLV